MTNLDKLPKITKLAKMIGDKLISTDFIKDGIMFRYEIGLPRFYEEVDSGIETEIARLERLLAVDI